MRQSSNRNNLAGLFSKNNDMILADDEPLSARFQRAVVLQRAGDHMGALKEYKTFIKAAESCDVDQETFAEVHVNVGAINVKLKNMNEAKRNFQEALSFREMGSAHINLALLALAEGKSSMNPVDGIDALKTAQIHCQRVLELNDDNAAIQIAEKLLRDIKMMLKS
jgi:tetratricopeptide (TPR) repeat protein